MSAKWPDWPDATAPRYTGCCNGTTSPPPCSRIATKPTNVGQGRRRNPAGGGRLAHQPCGPLIQKEIFVWHTLCIEGIPPSGAYQFSEENIMFGWAITLLILAIIAGIFGFAGVAGTAAWIARILEKLPLPHLKALIQQRKK